MIRIRFKHCLIHNFPYLNDDIRRIYDLKLKKYIYIWVNSCTLYVTSGLWQHQVTSANNSIAMPFYMYLVQLIPNSFWLAFCKQWFFCFHSTKRKKNEYRVNGTWKSWHAWHKRKSVIVSPSYPPNRRVHISVVASWISVILTFLCIQWRVFFCEVGIEGSMASVQRNACPLAWG